MKIETASVNCVILYFEERICEEVLNQVQHAYATLKRLPHIINLTPSYHSILIEYNIKNYSDSEIKIKVEKSILSSPYTKELKKGKLIEIPVDYSRGLDLKHIANMHNLSSEEVIAKHTAFTYRVYAIGFMEGFAYLANIDRAIRTPRLSTPRSKVPKGSVAIAQLQTAIYPKDSAGGWNIVGHTDFDNFDSFEIGDSVRFISV